MKKLLLILTMSALIPLQSISAEVITIAGVWKEGEFLYDRDTHAFPWIVRSLALPALTRTTNVYGPGQQAFSLALADSMKMEGDFSKWYFRLSNRYRFSSGQRLSVEDVQYSVERCKQFGLLKGIKAVKEHKTREDNQEQWVSFLLKNNALSADFPRLLADCPIMQKEISTLFDERNGKGTTIVGAGEFALTEFDLSRKQLELSRIYMSKGKVQALQKVYLRGYPSEREGLTALRVGTADMLVVNASDILELVADDETLAFKHCAERNVVFRKGVEFNCGSEIDFSSLRILR